MGWKETCAVEERMRFVVAVQKHEELFAAVCQRFDVSRRTGYKWLARFQEEGAAACSIDRVPRGSIPKRLGMRSWSAALRSGVRTRPGDR